MTRLRQVALCDAHVAARPWNLASESRSMAVWRAAQNLTSADASQERAIVDAVIEHLTELKEGRHG